MTDEARALRIKILGILSGLLIICATVAACILPADRWAKLGHFLTDPATATAVVTLGGALVALYLRAKASPAVVLLLALLAAGSLEGCTAAQTRDTLNAVKTAIPWVCGGAKKLCEALGDAEACAAIAIACDVGETVLGSEEGSSATDAQGAEHANAVLAEYPDADMRCMEITPPCGTCPWCIAAEHRARELRSDEPTGRIGVPGAKR